MDYESEEDRVMMGQMDHFLKDSSVSCSFDKVASLD